MLWDNVIGCTVLILILILYMPGITEIWTPWIQYLYLSFYIQIFLGCCNGRTIDEIIRRAQYTGPRKAGMVGNAVASEDKQGGK